MALGFTVSVLFAASLYCSFQDAGGAFLWKSWEPFPRSIHNTWWGHGEVQDGWWEAEAPPSSPHRRGRADQEIVSKSLRPSCLAPNEGFSCFHLQGLGVGRKTLVLSTSSSFQTKRSLRGRGVCCYQWKMLCPLRSTCSSVSYWLMELTAAPLFSLHLTSERPHRDDHRLHLLHILPSHDSSSRKYVGGVAYSQDSATASILQFCLNILSHIALLVLVSMSKYL